MRGRSRTATLVIAVVLVLLAACGGDGDGDGDAAGSPSPTSAVDSAARGASTSSFAGREITLVVRDGVVVGGARRVEVDAGERVRITVTADADDRVHVHVHDLLTDVSAGEPATIEFDATVPGKLEVELEDSGVLLVELVVG